PNLDREIAIKVLKRHDAHPSLRKRLLREGRAMARLKHPNVLTVYEVGTDNDRDFIAMELVDGSSLDQWLTRNPTRDDVIRALLSAGRGLAAAHAAGLVHRDFKPHNVLRSRNGRVLVTDFGLARGLGDDAAAGVGPAATVRVPPTAGLDETLDAVKSPTPSSSSSNVRTDSVLDAPLTQTGALIGTPAYMAPEQFRGADPDPRTDQFAFCVTAWQALTGSRPHTGTTLDELRRSAERGIGNVASTLSPPLRAVLARGLDPDPEKRWPDLDALLDQLEHIERPRRSRWVIPAVLVGVLALVGVTVLMTRRTNETPLAKKAAGCEPADQVFADAWSTKLRDQLWTAAQAAQISEPLFAQATDPFAEFRKRWIASYAEICNATPDARTAARVGCLLDARDQVSALALAMRSASSRVYENFDAHGILPNLAGCTGPRPVASPPIPPEKRTRVIAVIAGAFMTMDSTRLAEAIDRLEREANEIGWAPLLPRVLTTGANAYLRRHELANARELFKRAIELAGPANDARITAIARLGLLEASMIELVTPGARRKRGELHPEIASALTYARSAVAVAGDDPILLGSVALLEGQAYAALARWSLDKREYNKAIALVQNARHQWATAGDLHRAARAAVIEADFYLQRGDERAVEDAQFAARDAATSLERAELPRIDTLTELRAQLAFARGMFSEASAHYRELARRLPPSTAPVRKGIVLDGDGRPVQGASVLAWTGELHGDPLAVATDVREVLEEVVTASDGSFRIAAHPDTALIAALGQSRSAPRLAGTGDVTLRFQPTRVLTGKLASSNLGGVMVFAKVPLGTSAWIVRAPLKSDHTYSLGGIPAGAIILGSEGPAGDGWRIVTAGPNARLSWPVGAAIEIIVRGRIEAEGATVWVFRGAQTARPTTRVEAEDLAARARDVATARLAPIGKGATDNGLELYEPGDHHAVIPGGPGDTTVACVAPGEAPTTPVTCTEIAVTTGKVFDHSDGRVGTDTQPVVINPVP
ncbi:MAG: protein kinase, partial [Deltaproteobacteria bacterium]|nr:protein kinase [Deltaproteobacteria bacterium]